MIKRLSLLGLTLYMAFTLSGCGAIFLGSTRTIDITGNPEGAEVSGTPSIGSYTVPTALKLTRGKSYELTFRKAGYKEKTVQIEKKFLAGTLIADIFLAGIIGIIVDATTGSWYGHTPSSVDVMLEKASMGVEGPDQIHITLSQSGNKSSEVQIIGADAAEGVQVELTETK